ncbi:MAG: SpaH/EbpB family LPXTG-anchored major pilin [Faecousia sp.]
MKMFKRTLAMLLCAVMALGLMAVAASAAADTALIDTNAKGSITITKYESATKGDNGDGTNDPTIPEGAKPLAGVTFTLYKVMNAAEVVAYYNGTNTQKVTVDTYLENGAIKSGYPVSGTATTNASGVATFSNLDVGMYVVIETKYPDKVTIPCDPFLVSIPMTNPDNETAWMYDVNVYPKNATSEGNVILKKLNENSHPLPGVVFQLYKLSGSNWKAEGDPCTTDASGQIQYSNLTPGNYKVIEISAPNGYIVDGRPTYFNVTENNTVQDGTPSGPPHSNATFSGSGTKTLTITLSNYKPVMDKRVRDGNDKYGAMPGEEFEYGIRIHVPRNIADLKTFTLTDKMGQMILAQGTNGKYKVTVETAGSTGAPTSISEDCYSVSTEQGGSTMIVTFDPRSLNYCADKDIYVYYSTEIREGSDIAGQVYTNNAELKYTSKINQNGGEEATDTISDSESIYNFMINISKVGDTTGGTPLGGVQFELYMADKTTKVTFTQWGNGEYFADSRSDKTIVSTSHVQSSLGTLQLEKLPAGTYYLKEIKTADGYNLLSDMIEINLNFTVDESGATPVYKIGDTVYPDNSISVEVINKKGFTLPQTGGVGTLMFILIGGVLMAGGIVLLTNTGKKRAV